MRPVLVIGDSEELEPRSEVHPATRAMAIDELIDWLDEIGTGECGVADTWLDLETRASDFVHDHVSSNNYDCPPGDRSLQHSSDESFYDILGQNDGANGDMVALSDDSDSVHRSEKDSNCTMEPVISELQRCIVDDVDNETIGLHPHCISVKVERFSGAEVVHRWCQDLQEQNISDNGHSHNCYPWLSVFNPRINLCPVGADKRRKPDAKRRDAGGVTPVPHEPHQNNMAARNPGIAYDPSWLENVHINLPAIKRRAETLGTRRCVKKQWQAAWLLRVTTCIDLTTLSGDDTPSNVSRLCFKAKHPIRDDLIKAMAMQDKDITVGAVCVYPNRVADCVQALKAANASDIPIASVATGFPTGQVPLKTRLEEIRQAVADGASEIDIVINRHYALTGNWKGVYEEVKNMKEACGDAHLKTILATGELGCLENVHKASVVCMMAGADFIKTSTGKEGVNAIFPVALVMVRAIREYFQKTGYKVGFKPAGGIRTAKDSCTWLSLMKEELGDEWMKSGLFRIGASGLVTDIERQLFHYVYGRYAAAHEIPMS
ncbi:hypothetical protein ScPMuIL_012782 [Solemya velum]